MAWGCMKVKQVNSVFPMPLAVLIIILNGIIVQQSVCSLDLCLDPVSHYEAGSASAKMLQKLILNGQTRPHKEY